MNVIKYNPIYDVNIEMNTQIKWFNIGIGSIQRSTDKGIKGTKKLEAHKA